MRWEKEPDRLVPLFVATARPTLRQRIAATFPAILVAVLCILVVCVPLLALS